jgi:succinate dehydrogenase/fumarate reductase-like Fe-S protein
MVIAIALQVSHSKKHRNDAEHTYCCRAVCGSCARVENTKKQTANKNRILESSSDAPELTSIHKRASHFRITTATVV